MRRKGKERRAFISLCTCKNNPHPKVISGVWSLEFSLYTLIYRKPKHSLKSTIKRNCDRKHNVVKSYKAGYYKINAQKLKGKMKIINEQHTSTHLTISFFFFRVCLHAIIQRIVFSIQKVRSTCFSYESYFCPVGLISEWFLTDTNGIAGSTSGKRDTYS